jgi:quercetin dioxygenase-like cupin family protein
VIFTFAKAGDVLNWHTHGGTDAHITIVARGRFRMDIGHNDGAGERVVTQTLELAEGNCVDTDAGVYHELTALTDDARIFNIVKGVG